MQVWNERIFSHLASPSRGDLACSCSSSCGGRGRRGAREGWVEDEEDEVVDGDVANGGKSGAVGVGGEGDRAVPSLVSLHLSA